MPNRSRQHTDRPQGRSPNPTGRRPRGPRHFASEDAAAAFDGLPEGDTHKEIGDLLHAVGRRAGWTRALIEHFEKLLDWTRPDDWIAGAQPIVWLSVAETAKELDISPSQVRRNEAAMHRLGAISWKDSPNHRRYGSRGPDGAIEEAWGVNLAPAAALVPELRELHERRSENRARHRHLRHAVAGARGALTAAIETASARRQLDAPSAEAWRRLVAEAAPKSLHDLQHRDLEHSLNQLRYLDAVLQQDLAALQADRNPPAASDDTAETAEEPCESAVEMRALPEEHARLGKHPCLPPLDYTTRDSILRETVDGASPPEREGVDESSPPIPPPEASGKPIRIPADALFEILPDRIRDWLSEPRPGWPDVVDAARHAAHGLGISDHAWTAACDGLGRREAAAAVAVIAIKHDLGLIRSPGGYLRSMTDCAAAGELDLRATIFGLQDRKRRSARPGAPPRGAAE